MNMVLVPGSSARMVSTHTADGTSFTALVNEGLRPGVRVLVDDDAAATATVCSTEASAPYASVRFERTGERLRVASWRLACLD